jgi:hypothetical protein
MKTVRCKKLFFRPLDYYKFFFVPSHSILNILFAIALPKDLFTMFLRRNGHESWSEATNVFLKASRITHALQPVEAAPSLTMSVRPNTHFKDLGFIVKAHLKKVMTK